jgi:hypothetical protein
MIKEAQDKQLHPVLSHKAPHKYFKLHHSNPVSRLLAPQHMDLAVADQQKDT